MIQPNIVVIGSLNMDVVVKADRPPAMGETILGHRVHFIPGGKGANQAVSAARLGANTVMIGAVGEDAFGEQLQQSLIKDGVKIDCLKKVPGVNTGLASILLAQGDNSIIVVQGANAHLLPEDLERHENVIADADVVLLQLEIPIETVQHAAKLAKRHGKMVILNPAPARELPDELLQYIDYITPNRSELQVLSGINDGPDQLELAMNRLLQKRVRHVITTLGSEGAAYLTSDKKVKTISSYKVSVVDTTGAGDAFNAGFAYALALQKTLPESIAFASRVSALAVTKFGAQAGMPTLKEVEKYAEICEAL